jgi:hypothetical protein
VFRKGFPLPRRRTRKERFEENKKGNKLFMESN